MSKNEKNPKKKTVEDSVLGSKLKYVSESHLKKRQHKIKHRQAAAAAEKAKKKKFKKKRLEIFKRAEKYVREYKRAERELIRSKRQAQNLSRYFIPAEAKVLCVVRIRGINALHPRTKKILQLFRLRQIHNAVFLKVNNSIMIMLRKIEHYVTYGPPNQKTVSEMIYKRGFGKVNKQRIPLTDNQIIEDALGKYNIICIEDLIHEIYTCGPHFKEANNFLWPFKLSSPRGGYSKGGKVKHFAEGGDAGNREEFINDFVRRMN